MKTTVYRGEIEKTPPLTAEDVRRIAFLATQPPLTPDDVRHIAREEVNAALVRLADQARRAARGQP